jgi:hypothetical protein
VISGKTVTEAQRHGREKSDYYLLLSSFLLRVSVPLWLIAELIESPGQFARYLFGAASFDLVPLHHMDDIAVLQQRDRWR